MKTPHKIEINQDLYDKVVNALPDQYQEALKNSVKAANAAVNLIENSGRIQTTKDWYGDYLPLIKSKTALLVFKIAGAGKGAEYAAMINFGHDVQSQAMGL